MGELANRIRAKYPGAYDSLDDATLEAKIVAKYPEYKSLASPEPVPSKRPQSEMLPSHTPRQQMGLGEQLGKAFLGGLEGFGIGVGQGISYLGGALNPSEDVQKMRQENIDLSKQMEQERRDRQAIIKTARGQEPGITNPASWAEFAGETAPTAMIPAARIKTLGQAVGYGLAGGIGAGAIAPITEDESRLGTMAQYGAGGAVLGPVGYGAVKGVQALPSAIKNIPEAVATGVGRVADRVYDPEKYAKSAADRVLGTNIRKFAPPKPSEMKGKARITKVDNTKNAMIDLVKLQDEYTLGVDSKGNPIRRVPRNGEELVDASNQVLSKIIERQNVAAKALGEADEIVPVDDIISALKSVTPSNGYIGARPEQATRLISQLEAASDGRGGLSPVAAMKILTGLNNDIKAIYSGANVNGDAAEVLGMVAKKLRDSANKTFESSANPTFAAERRMWGRIHALQEDAIRQLEKDATGGRSSVYDILGVEQLGSGLVTLNPNQVKRAVASFSAGKIMNWKHNKNRAIQNAFKAAKELAGDEKHTFGEIVTPPPSTKFFDPTVGVPIEKQQGTSLVRRNAPQPEPLPKTFFDPTVGAVIPKNMGNKVVSRKGAGEAAREIVKETPKGKPVGWKTVEKFAAQFGFTLEEAADILAKAQNRGGQ